jgi:hypothetical protein
MLHRCDRCEHVTDASMSKAAAAGGLGAATGPLIGGVVTSAISWRASFGLQVLVVAWIILLARKIADPGPEESRPRFDLTGAVLSAAGLTFVVLGLLQSRTCVLKDYLADGVEADYGHREPAGRLVTGQDPERGEDLQRAEDEGDPAGAVRTGGLWDSRRPAQPTCSAARLRAPPR